MLHFRDQLWLLDSGSTFFSALVGSAACRAYDVVWRLHATYVAGGACWRRVLPWDRPRVDLRLAGFRPTSGRWSGIGDLCDWDAPGIAASSGSRAVVEYRANPGMAPETGHGRLFWRVVRHVQQRFLVEFVCVAGERPPPDERRVLCDGTGTLGSHGIEIWRDHSCLYMIEEIPFGIVDVRVSAAIQDPGLWAIERAAALVGAETPEFVEIFREDVRGREAGDVWVKLHFNGRYLTGS